MLHLLAIAHEAGVNLRIQDFNRVGAKVPLLASLSPHGRYHMGDLDALGLAAGAAGGVPLVMKELLDHGKEGGPERRLCHDCPPPTSVLCLQLVRRIAFISLYACFACAFASLYLSKGSCTETASR